VGRGVIRSHGGWKAVRDLGRKVPERIKGDERILGHSDFVLQVLEASAERFERYYEMKRLGCDLKTVQKRVCEIFDIAGKDIYSGSREKTEAQARGLFCYWAARELGYGLTGLSRRLGMTQTGVGYAVKRGEQYAEENNCRLRET
jgi:chromosomal replication initiation ATPase DnaA